MTSSRYACRLSLVMSVFPIHGKETQRFVEKLSLCTARLSAASIHGENWLYRKEIICVTTAGMIVCVRSTRSFWKMNETCFERAKHVSSCKALDRQTRESIKLIQTVLYDITGEQYVKGFPFLCRDSLAWVRNKVSATQVKTDSYPFRQPQLSQEYNVKVCVIINLLML